MENSKFNHWGDEETKFLISMWRQDEILRQTSKSRDFQKKRGGKVYAEMSSSMAAAGYNRSATQINNKMKAMRAAYNKVNEHNNRSGRDRITCPYYNEMHSFLGGRPALNPPPGLIETSSSPSPSSSATAPSTSAEEMIAGDPEVEAVEAERDANSAGSKTPDDTFQDNPDDDLYLADGEDPVDGCDETQADDSQNVVWEEEDSQAQQNKPRRCNSRNRNRKDSGLKDALNNAFRASRERDRVFMREERERRVEEMQIRKEELQLMKDLLQFDRENMRLEREERDRRERAQQVEREQQFQMMMAVLQGRQDPWNFQTPYSFPQQRDHPHMQQQPPQQQQYQRPQHPQQQHPQQPLHHHPQQLQHQHPQPPHQHPQQAQHQHPQPQHDYSDTQQFESL